MATQRSGIRVLLVDDHRILREGLRSCLPEFCEFQKLQPQTA